MKKNDWILAGGICGAALVLWLVSLLFLPGSRHTIEITVDGEVYGDFSLDKNQTIKINDTNVCVIENGKARMEEADCPDQLCVHQKAVDSRGGTIVCLPNRVVIEARRAEKEPEVDAVA